jgi:hypothetical protein
MPQFAPGNKAAAGRRKRNEVALDAVAIHNLQLRVAKDIPTVIDKLMEKAKGGDMRATDMLLSRIWPVRSQIEDQLQRDIDELRASLDARVVNQ